jgi:hypothetical protein
VLFIDGDLVATLPPGRRSSGLARGDVRRSQANSAKLLADNATLMLLYELEVLEKGGQFKLHPLLRKGSGESGDERAVTRSSQNLQIASTDRAAHVVWPSCAVAPE